MWKVAALACLDQDRSIHGRLKSERWYSGQWKKSRSAVRVLIRRFHDHVDDLRNTAPQDHPKDHLNATDSDTYGGVKDHRQDHVGKDRLETTEGPPQDHPKDHLTRVDSSTYEGVKDHRQDHCGTTEGPLQDHILDPDPDPERRRHPPRKPSARGVGVANSRVRQASEQVRLALEHHGPESVELRAHRVERYRILSELFLASGQVADEARLRCYFRSTSEIPTQFLELACDEARTTTDGTWPPAEGKIVAAGKIIEARARKRARERA